MKKLYIFLLIIFIIIFGLIFLVFLGVKSDKLKVNIAKDVKDSYYYNTYHNKDDLVLVHFWASWCEPCIEEIPFLNRLKDNNPDVKFLSLSHDRDTLKTIQSIKKYSFNWEELLLKDFNHQEDIKRLLNGRSFIKVSALPTTHFIKNGKILETNAGQLDSLKTYQLIEKYKN